MKPTLREELLLEILSQPTAPYREHHVSSLFESLFTKKKVPYFKDPIGNLVIGAKNLAQYKKILAAKNAAPLRLYIAHMDHPGFHGVKWLSETELEAKWYGGTPTYYLENAPVWLASDQGRQGYEEETRILNATLIKKGAFDSIDTLRMQTSPELQKRFPKASDLFGGYRFRKPVWKEERLLYTKAADDLVGAFAIASLALDVFSKKSTASKTPFLGLLTRAEEVGWIGAIGHLEQGWLTRAKRKVLCISLETSRTLPGALLGKGPVVRLGDKTTVFDSYHLRNLTVLAEKVLPGQFQRRIMDGGSCEASATTAYGLKSIGISIPLGNYHNQSFEGGPDSMGPMGPAPEFVHLDDIEGMLKLCHALLKSTPENPKTQPWTPFRTRIAKSYKEARPLLAKYL